jgi:coniferyl-aldehyde dehydrogenase
MGVEGFRRISYAKGIYARGRWNASDLMRASFGRLADVMLRMILW